MTETEKDIGCGCETGEACEEASEIAYTGHEAARVRLGLTKMPRRWRDLNDREREAHRTGASHVAKHVSVATMLAMAGQVQTSKGPSSDDVWLARFVSSVHALAAVREEPLRIVAERGGDRLFEIDVNASSEREAMVRLRALSLVDGCDVRVEVAEDRAPADAGVRAVMPLGFTDRSPQHETEEGLVLDEPHECGCVLESSNVLPVRWRPENLMVTLLVASDYEIFDVRMRRPGESADEELPSVRTVAMVGQMWRLNATWLPVGTRIALRVRASRTTKRPFLALMVGEREL